MTRVHIVSGSTFEEQIGYSRAVVQGDWIFVSGTTGYDYATMTIDPDVVAQARQAIRNIESALEAAGASLADVVRVHYLLPDIGDFAKTFPVLKKWLGDIRPAATAYQAALADPRMRIEIEVTVFRG